eukprot:g12028.t1
MLRIVRMGKLARATRLVTLNSVLTSLELLIKYLAASTQMLFWSFCLLTFIQCVAGILASTLCLEFINNVDNDEMIRKEVYLYYGTFTRTFLTMFEVLFANWGPPCRVLVENISEYFSIFFLLYRCVLGFAVLNVVNAVFVQQTIKTASSDEELAFKQKERDIAMNAKAAAAELSGAQKDAADYYVRAMEKSQEKADWFKRLGSLHKPDAASLRDCELGQKKEDERPSTAPPRLSGNIAPPTTPPPREVAMRPSTGRWGK